MQNDNLWYCVVETMDPAGQPYWMPLVQFGANQEIAARRAVETSQPLNEGWRVRRVSVTPYEGLSEWQCEPTQKFTLGQQVRHLGAVVS